MYTDWINNNQSQHSLRKYLMKNLWANFDTMTLKNINGAKKCNSAFIQHF